MEKTIDPAMHTAEHLLNQAMIRRFGGGRCFSAHIEKRKSKCDYRYPRPLSRADAARIEDDVNAVLAENLPVTEDFVPFAAAAAAYDLGRLPVKPDVVRIIKIGDFDAVPCAGPHVKRTGELGRFKIISTDHADGVLRIRYRLSKQ